MTNDVKKHLALKEPNGDMRKKETHGWEGREAK